MIKPTPTCLCLSYTIGLGTTHGALMDLRSARLIARSVCSDQTFIIAIRSRALPPNTIEYVENPFRSSSRSSILVFSPVAYVACCVAVRWPITYSLVPFFHFPMLPFMHSNAWGRRARNPKAAFSFCCYPKCVNREIRPKAIARSMSKTVSTRLSLPHVHLTTAAIACLSLGADSVVAMRPPAGPRCLGCCPAKPSCESRAPSPHRSGSRCSAAGSPQDPNR
jgi:hypothetical protein